METTGKFDADVREFLVDAYEERSDRDLAEYLTEDEVVFCETTGERRWWSEQFKVALVNGSLIGYEWANVNRDESIFDVGWAFPLNSVCFVEPKEVTVVTYVKKEKK